MVENINLLDGLTPDYPLRERKIKKDEITFVIDTTPALKKLKEVQDYIYLTILNEYLLQEIIQTNKIPKW